LIIILAALLYKYPLEQYLSTLIKNTPALADRITDFEKLLPKIEYIRLLIAKFTAFAAFLILALKTASLKSIRYTVTANRIEYARGLLNRKIDNLDMFRIVDLSMHASILDRILGIGTVTLTTTDKTHPTFIIEKVRRPRLLYEIITRLSLAADRSLSVIHLE